jgi:hypothetical protein
MLSLFVIANGWNVFEGDFIQGEDSHEAVFLELCYIVFCFLIESRSDLIWCKRGFPS